ncbi:MAG: hypothetical protein A2589_02515 [Candidatus Vogelbacteria bacterium RIFOXYD1_FULL_46_19]|uniref:Band 7 domain-containing protein n=1 Tax=Candidatus Vogelbacteria bacterium RIFOXYD1_FULL_46_19 TaxID=1802439 RepID=A0A1G2QH25_9BACT|nr:MAG: hypothetical protein A2589_02515 [Candidatus Vogelbacteria bacterium RIFOXYD1_FULL_46_19]
MFWLGIIIVVSTFALILIPGGVYIFQRTKDGTDNQDIWLSRPVVASAIYLVITTLSIVGLYADYQLKWPYWSWTVFILLLIPLHLILSIRKVDIDELGVILFFGRVVQDLEKTGPVWIPWPLYQIEQVTAHMQELELPAASSKIWRGEIDGMPKDQGLQPAFRVVHLAQDNEEYLKSLRNLGYKIPSDEEMVKNEAQDKSELDALFRRRITSEVEIFIRWRVSPGNAARFLRNYGGIEAVNSQLEDTVKGTVLGNLAKMSAGTALTLIDTLNAQLRDELDISLISLVRSNHGSSEISELSPEEFRGLPEKEKRKLIGSLGIVFEEARIKALNLNHALNKSMAGAAQAQYDKLDIEARAEAEKTRLSREGEGKAEAAKQLLLAEAEGQAALAEVAASEGGQAALAFKALQTGLEQSKHTIIPAGDGFASLMGLAVSAKEVLKNQDQGEKENSE